MTSKMKLSTENIFLTVAMLVIVVGLALTVCNRPSEKILKLTVLAEQGDATAQFELGGNYLLELEGVSKDDSEAMKWYRKSAEQGYSLAQHMVGVMYKFGYGVPKDLVQAYMWDNLAAIQNNRFAKFRDRVKKDMTPEQITEGERLTHEWMLQHPK